MGCILMCRGKGAHNVCKCVSVYVCVGGSVSVYGFTHCVCECVSMRGGEG